jgi:hypothetical protein
MINNGNVLLSENQRRIYQLEDLDIDEGIILKCILNVMCWITRYRFPTEPRIVAPRLALAAPSLVSYQYQVLFSLEKAAGA